MTHAGIGGTFPVQEKDKPKVFDQKGGARQFEMRPQWVSRVVQFRRPDDGVRGCSASVFPALPDVPSSLN